VSFAERLADDSRWVVPFEPELDIVVWAPRAASTQLASKQSQRIFTAAAQRGLHLALVRLPVRYFPDFEKPQGRMAGPAAPPETSSREEMVLCLRSVLMKPEHREWLDQIWEILGAAYNDACSAGL
jgi:hypothetical protein